MFALLALCVQLLAAAGVARSDVVCQDLATGHSQRESVAEQLLCERCGDDGVRPTDSGDGPAADNAGCVDTPVAGGDVAPLRGPRVITDGLSGPTFTALPACVTPTLWPTARIPTASDAVALLDTARLSVRTVVLVI